MILQPLCIEKELLPCKPMLPFITDNLRELNFRWSWKMGLQLARALPPKGNTSNTSDTDQSVENFDRRKPLINAQDVDDQQPSYDNQDDTNSANLLKDAYASTTDSNLDISQEEGMESLKDAVGESDLGETALRGTIVAGLILIGAVGGIGIASYIYREHINAFLIDFSDFIEGYGAAGYALFVAVYAGLEVLAIPAIPLTMSAGLLFGTFTGTIIVSISGTIAATAAFLIARYLARDRILKLAAGNKKFLAIDKAIGEKSFRVVALLRLSPLLPFSLGNYLYGLTSVKLLPYVLGSWLGMLPGTWAYVSAGAVGRALIQQEAKNPFSGGREQLLTLGVGLLITLSVAAYVTRLAKVLDHMS
ncbi:hypothetical protein GOP47_0011484 [Adiantum capillus-veneris]|uniref:VTT domain-containing protein n=1 Tax=Adiantum capillus-veneris TaxID=13818 RepID=A0A9D4UTD6_ADICA|nr:hypothetical protein GOP47_0011484 [Adiantum capillus-veneris]